MDTVERTRLGIGVTLAVVGSIIALLTIADPTQRVAVSVAAVCLALWLTEAVPTFVPTLILVGLVPLVLDGPTYRVGAVMQWMADPVLLLFLGGFSLGVAAQRYGIDAVITGIAVRLSRGRRQRLVMLVMLATATLSMWMSNTAAAAMMIAALRPIFANSDDPRFRLTLLIGIAMAANLGGMGTPIGSPPNAIALAALGEEHPVSVLRWMMLAVPCVAMLLVIGFFVLRRRYRLSEQADTIVAPVIAVSLSGKRPWAVVIIFSVMVLAWLSEPLHGVSTSLVAVLGMIVLFGSGLLGRTDLRNIDWGTLLLIAGGMGLGRLLEQSGAITSATSLVDWEQFPSGLRIAALILTGSLLSAVMSNTATATMIIPLAYVIDPNPSTPILVALGTSLGMLFMISTPPNAMVHGEGGVRAGDLFWTGIVMVVVGVGLLSVLGPLVLG